MTLILSEAHLSSDIRHAAQIIDCALSALSFSSQLASDQYSINISNDSAANAVQCRLLEYTGHPC